MLAPGTLVRWKDAGGRNPFYNEIAIVLENIPNGSRLKFANVTMLLHEIHVEKYVKNGMLHVLWSPGET